MTDLCYGHTIAQFSDPAQAEPLRLRELACWYREFAERAGSPAIWEARLRTADELEEEADRLDKRRKDRPTRADPRAE